MTDNNITVDNNLRTRLIVIAGLYSSAFRKLLEVEDGKILEDIKNRYEGNPLDNLSDYINEIMDEDIIICGD